MRTLLIALSLIITISVPSTFAAPAQSGIVRLAPDFTYPGVGSKTQTLKGLRGQPVVLIIAKSPKVKQVKVQAKNLRAIYQQFANKQVIFAAAFTDESGLVPSDIPFIIVNNGAAVANAYGVQENLGQQPSNLWNRVVARASGMQEPFNIVIIGKDGNIDYQTNKVLPPERVRDVIQNSFAVQANTGR